MDKDNIFDTLSRYITDLYNGVRDKQFDSKYNTEEPSILKIKIQNALKHLQSGKTLDPRL